MFPVTLAKVRIQLRNSWSWNKATCKTCHSHPKQPWASELEQVSVIKAQKKVLSSSNVLSSEVSGSSVIDSVTGPFHKKADGLPNALVQI